MFVRFTLDSRGFLLGSSRKPVLYQFLFRAPGAPQVEEFFNFTRFVPDFEKVIGFELVQPTERNPVVPKFAFSMFRGSDY
jgi:hypothetical protein